MTLALTSQTKRVLFKDPNGCPIFMTTIFTYLLVK